MLATIDITDVILMAFSISASRLMVLPLPLMRIMGDCRTGKIKNRSRGVGLETPGRTRYDASGAAKIVAAPAAFGRNNPKS
jgi:hypothetical protein